MITIDEIDFKKFDELTAITKTKRQELIKTNPQPYLSAKFAYDVGFSEQEVFHLLNALYTHYKNAVNALKQQKWNSFIKYLACASSTLITKLSHKFPSLYFIECYSYLANNIFNFVIELYEKKHGKLTEILDEFNLANYLYIDNVVRTRRQDLNSVCHPNEYDKKLFASYFCCEPLITNFIPRDREFSKNAVEAFKSLYAKSAKDNKCDDYDLVILKHALIDEADVNPELMTAIISQINATKDRLEREQAKSCFNIFIKSPAMKIAQLSSFVASIQKAKKMRDLRQSFDETLNNPEIKQHRNFFMRCASCFFNVGVSTTMTEMQKACDMLPTALTSLI